jgi:hypothetical protein
MKKLSHIFTFLVLFAFFTAPSLVGAVACTQSCASGYTCSTVTGTCVLAGNLGAGSVNTTYLDFYKSLVQGTVNDYLVPVLIAIAFIVFLFGVYKYFILGAADEKSRTDGKQFVLWGVIGLVVILSVWGLVNLVKDTIIPSAAGTNHPTYPTL